MSVDFAALAHSVRTLPDVRSCLLLSRDGLVMAADPGSAEEASFAFWNDLARVGRVARGFVQTDTTLWVFSERGPYQVVVEADPAARPGIVLGALEQALMAGEQVRLQERETLRAVSTRTDGASGGSAPRFRAPLHREPEPQVPPDRDREQKVPVRVPVASATGEERPPQDESAAVGPATEDWEVDVVQIAREFGGLYSED